MTEWNKDEAFASAQKAEEELKELVRNNGSITDLAIWWKRWYNGESGQHPTGHRALGRLLVKIANGR